MFRSDVGVRKSPRISRGERQHFQNARSVRNNANYFLIRTSPNLFFDLKSDCVKIEAVISKYVNSNALTECYQSQEQVFSSDEIVIEPTGLFSGEREDLICAGCKFILVGYGG